MDILLGKITSQAMNYAIRSGVAITTTYAINQCSHLLKQTPHSDQHRQELLQLQRRLESKIRIISPAIDMIELIASRGNTTLESAVSLTKTIRFDIQRLGSKIAETVERRCRKGKDDSELRAVIESIKSLLIKIEDAIPLINLAITTSGVSLTTKLSGTISPSRLLQASTFLTTADANYNACMQRGSATSRQQVGPTWTLSLYMLFAGHSGRAVDEKGVRETTWKEVTHKARVKLVRVPLEQLYALSNEQEKMRRGSGDLMEGEEVGSEFAYQLVVIEDLDDDRAHTFDDEDVTRPSQFEDVLLAGIRDVVPIHEISKIFYADTGKILNIGSDDDVNNPVLLIKRDVHAETPRRMLHRSQMSMYGYHDDSEMMEDGEEQSEIDAQLHRESAPNTPLKDLQSSPRESSSWRLPVDLDPEWMAFEVYTEEEDTDSSSSEPEEATNPSRPTSSSNRADSLGPDLAGALSNLNLHSPSPMPSTTSIPPSSHPSHPRIKTSLSLLEMLLKLTALQQFRQESHLAIEDELLNFFLEDSATAGAGANKDYRRKVRNEAVRRVGFDPYDESPVKRRGEEYIATARGRADGPMSDYYRPVEEMGSLSSPPAEFARPSIEVPCETCGSPSPRARGCESWSAPGSPTVQAPRSGRGGALPKAASQGSLLATPPRTAKVNKSVLRAQSEPKTGSPLAREVMHGEEPLQNGSLFEEGDGEE